jgi:exopolysaccharide biosynthesis polyprenyl glycosylphosphotransferase
MMAAEHTSAGSEAAGHQPGGTILPGMAPPSARRAVELSGTYLRRPGAREVAAAGPLPGPPPRGTGAALARLAMPLADVAGLAAAAVITAVGGGGPGLLPCAVFAGAVVVILTAGGLHRLRICLRVSDQAGRILAATAVSALALAPWLPAMTLGRLALWSAGLVFVSRAVMCAALRAAHRRGLLTEPALVIGAGTFGAYVAELMREHPEFGLRPQGFLDNGPPRQDLPLPTLGYVADIADVVTRLGIRRVIVCYSECRDEDMVALIRASRPLPADICLIPRLYELGLAVPRACLDEIWGIPLIPLRRYVHPRAGLWLKRAFDQAAGLVLLCLMVPLLLFLIALVRLRTGQAALFRQARVTRNGRVVQIMKLRTLNDHGDPDTRWAVTDEHCTRLGRWLRATHLDELPQLLNVARGEMSLVGPRPERAYFAERFSKEIPRYADRTRMPAGMTGWAQVNGLNGDTSIFERARFDNYYVEYWSPWMDLTILARTLAAMAAGGKRGKS